MAPETSKRSHPQPKGRSRASVALGRVLMRRLVPKLLRPEQVHRASQFETLGAAEDHIVFLGDSITHGGLWDEWFPDLPVLNRGIGGETSAQVLDRVGAAINRPRAVLLLIGTNDLSAGIPAAEIVARIAAIVREVERLAPGAFLCVQSVMPRTRQFANDIVDLNNALQDVVAAAPDNVVYLDLWPVLATPDGRLRDEFSIDHLHLNGAGYKAWTDLLRARIPVLAASG